jgi:hypothetical protein
MGLLSCWGAGLGMVGLPGARGMTSHERRPGQDQRDSSQVEQDDVFA